MRICVFGATGRVGRHVVRYALAAGHEVTAFVREEDGFAPDARLRVEPGDVRSTDDVARALAGAQAVVSALGSPNVAQPGTLLSDGMRAITSAMRAAGVRRVLAVAGSGVLDAPGGGLRHDQPGFPAMFRAISAEHAGTWAALRDSRLEWTLACCPTLTDGERTGRYLEAVDVLPGAGESISVQDTADFLVRELSGTRYLMRRVGLSY